MVFASLEFLTLFLPAFFLIYLLVPISGRNAVILVTSWVFYGWWMPMFLPLLVGVTGVGWAVGRTMGAAGRPADRGWMLVFGLVLLFGSLLWFKYANLLVGTVNDILALAAQPPFAWSEITLPIGLSFFVLQAASYLIDIQRGVVQAERSFVAFGAYLAMFGQLIAGPIVRYSWVDQDLVRRTFTFDGFAHGARRFAIGFALKVLIADALAPVVAAAFALDRPSLADAWLGCLAYTLQLFFDFSGYSAMAIGLGLMVGFQFHENFNDPYLACGLRDFWRRWHISLSTWLRDYLYVPLGGNRHGGGRTTISLMLTMAIGGLWHGASWTFLAWGCVHGGALAIERAALARGLRLPAPVNRLVTLLVVMLAWTLFRADDWATAQAMLAGQLGLHGVGLGDAMAVALRPAEVAWLWVGSAVVVWPLVAARVPGWVARVPVWWQAAWPPMVFLYALAALNGRATVPFLYFQF